MQRETGKGWVSGGWVRDGLLVLAALTIGWWVHGRHVVKAATYPSNLQFQLGMRSADALAIYSSDERAIYVYEGAMSGNSQMSCSYKFVVGQTGGSVQRVNCGMGRLTP